MTHPIVLILSLLTLSAGTAFGQTYLMDGSPVADCNGSFYDSGGPAGNYANSQNLTTTICSDGSSGTHIRLEFSGVDLAAGDEICFFDGQNVGAPLLSCSGDYPPGAPFLVQATAANASGCLTVSFNSDAAGTATGWAAVISCVPSCQTVLADLTSTSPAAIPADTGWIDICPGERVFFNGAGIYPQNGFSYPQSDLTTVFEWSFGDGDISYGPNTSHRYAEPGGYYVQLFLTDNQGCRSTNFINQRVRVSPKPLFSIATVTDFGICAGDTIQLKAGLNASTTDVNLLVLPQSSSFASGASRSDSLALPDGTGQDYETSIFFTEFSPGQALTNPDDLESICVNIEHSWMRDVEISLTCPNGQNIVLHNFGGQMGSQVYLGIPNDNDLFNPVPGTGFDYCWTSSAANPPWLEYANTVMPIGGGTLPAGDYQPYESFSGLLGCPLNGEWTITVTDLWPFDNGYIFSWGVNFKNTLYPNIETFTPALASWGWDSHPSIFFSTPDSIAAAPQNGGTAGYTFTVNDNFGCSWDTLLTIPVLPLTHPSCHTCSDAYAMLQDTSVCVGLPILLNAALLGQDTFEVTFEAFPNYLLGNSNHPHSNPYAAPIAVSSLGYNFLYNPIAQIASVCMDIETDFAADLNIYLRSPDGKQLELSTGNGAAGDNYKITCFTPTATTLIVGNAAPFNGTFKPEGNWANLNNAQVDGDWKLLVSDGFGLNDLGKVNWWSIAFNFFNNITYSWTNGNSLSCDDCPNPVATPSSTTTYTVETNDVFNCKHLDTVTVGMSTLFPAPPGLDVIGMSSNAMTWSWNAVSGATGYEVNVNNSGWLPANGNLSHVVSGLVSGDAVYIQVRAIGGGPNCPPAVASAGAPFFVCDLEGNLTNTLPTLCNGTSTGSAFISVSNANPPVQYFANGLPPAYTNGDLVNIFPAGNNFVIIADSIGCRDTIYFTITDAPPIMLTATPTDALCNGDPDGSATASATGGTGAFTFSWQNCTGGPFLSGATVDGLFAGCYNVTATDANGCTATSSVQVDEPEEFDFTTSQTPVSCKGGSDGTASIEVTGGTLPYGFMWDNGETGSTATGLNAGFHFVTITDGAGCQAATFVIVLEPAFLVVDSVSPKNVSCFGGINGMATVFASGGNSPYTFLWNDPQAQVTQMAQGLSVGNYSVTVTDAKGCTAVSSVTVGAPPDLIVGITGIVNEICSGECEGAATVTVSGGFAPYEYFWDNISLPNEPSVDELCAGVYMVTVQDFNGCTETGKVTIEPALPIDILFDAIPPSCANFTDGSIFASIAGGNPPYQVQWSNGSTGPSITNLACGDYRMTLTDNSGCQILDTIPLACPDSIKITSLIVVPVKCFGGNDGQITAQAQGGTGILTYQWNDPNAQTGPVAINLTAGNYTLTVSDGNGCIATATAQITQPDLLVATATKTDVTCFGGTDGTATANATGGTSPYDFLWNWTPSGQTISNLPAGNYTVTVVDVNGCTGTATVSVIQPPTPIQVFVSQSNTACFGQTNAEAVASATGGNGGPYNYNWSNGQTGPTADSLSGGSITVTATDSKGCTAVQGVEIQQFGEIIIGVVQAPPSCFGLTDGAAVINLLAGGAGMGDTTQYTYEWSIPNSPNSIFVSGLAGNQTYTVTVTDFEGCSGTHTFSVSEPPPIIVQIAVENVSCFGLSDGSATVTSIQNANLPVTYTWDNGTSGPEIDSLLAGTYILNVVDNDGCATSDTVQITQPDLLELTFEVQPLKCTGDSNAVISANIIGGTKPYSLQWSNGATTTPISNLGPGNYVLEIEDANGCILTDSVFIARPDSTEVQSEKTDPVCFGGRDGRIRLLVTGAQSPIRYSMNGGPFGGSSTFVGLGAGNYTFEVKDGNGCITTFTDALGQPPQVGVSAGLDTTITLGDSLLISADVFNAVGVVEYEWSSFLLENLLCVDTPTCSMIQVKPYQTNTYIVEVTDENGCRGEARVKVDVDKPRGVYVPSGFSPNGDFNNDLLVVYGKSRQIRNVVTFNVYDRWGELVYQDQNFMANDETRGWDGIFRGKECDPGVYVWYVEVEYFDGYREAAKGDVTLIR